MFSKRFRSSSSTFLIFVEKKLSLLLQTLRLHLNSVVVRVKLSTSYFVTNWLLSTNHRRIAVMYFLFIITTAFTGLALATAIRIELATPGTSFFSNNSERYLTVASVHAIVMVFFVIIPVLFGAFGNFLLPTQLGVRDVAFPRLNSFMFWVTPSGFVLLLHIFLFDKSSPDLIRHSCSSLRGLRSDSTITLSGSNKSLKSTNNSNSFILLGDKTTGSIGGRFLGGFLNPQHLVLKDHRFFDLACADRKQRISSDLIRRIRSFRSSDSSLITSEAVNASNSFTSKASLTKVSSWASNQLLAGWAFVTPYASRTRFSAVGKADIALIVVFSAGLGSVFSAVNYVITYRCVSSPVFKNRRELRPFFSDALLVGSRMMLAANPALLIAILFLLSDRHLNTSFFDFSGGGDAVLFQHLFWFFGHPEVYIIIIPCFGFANSLLPHFFRKRLSGRLSLQFSMYTIGFMGFAVWGHHMYMVGLANTTRTLYSTMTVMISVPASTKVLHWCVTMVNSAPQFDVSLLFLLSFTYFFTLGGLSGMFNAHIGFDVSLHDTFFVIGHFHVMLAGAGFSCVFAAFYFYFGSIFGVKYSKVFGILHFVFYFFGQLFTLIPMIWLGYSGMPRRIMDYPAYFGGWQSVASAGHLLSVISFVFFILMLLDSFYEGLAPVSKTLGVARLNTRLSFYAYERRRLSSGNRLYKLNPIIHNKSKLPALSSETSLISYVFN